MDPAWAQVAAHARSHHGTISTAAAHRLGITDQTLATWHRRGRLHRVAPQLSVVAGAPLSWHQRVTVAAASTAGWASHRTAAALWGLDGFPPGPVEVLTPHGRRRKRDGWIVHESRRFAGVDLDEVGGVPCTTVARTVLDLPAVAHPFLVAQALDHACRRWPGLLQTIAQRYVELACRGRPGSRLLRLMIEERLGRGRFVQSGFEASALRMIRAAGLPEPVVQHPVRDGDFVAFIDIAWPWVLLALECDSLAYHSGKRAHEWDRVRRRRLKLLGWETVEVTYDDVTKRREQTARELRALYQARVKALSGVRQ